MRKIIIYFEAGGGLAISDSSTFLIKTNRMGKFYEWSGGIFSEGEFLLGGLQRVISVSVGSLGYVVRVAAVSASLARTLNFVVINGDFNADEIEILSEGTANPFTGRLEVRNENGVLIADNGKPWVDGTYPPDAKNRAGLAGLHAAPAVINPKLDTALMGDESNKEGKLMTDEGAEYVRNALEKDEDNGL